MENQPKWTTVVAIIVAIICIILLFCYPLFIDAKTTSGNKNSLGVIQYQENPYSYLAGNVIAGYSVEDGKGLVIRVQPLNTYSLFTEDLLFCDDRAELFSGKSNPIVLTYTTRDARMVSGVGCHTLLRVDEMKTEQLP